MTPHAFERGTHDVERSLDAVQRLGLAKTLRRAAQPRYEIQAARERVARSPQTRLARDHARGDGVVTIERLDPFGLLANRLHADSPSRLARMSFDWVPILFAFRVH
jgi:hypothetical protein